MTGVNSVIWKKSLLFLGTRLICLQSIANQRYKGLNAKLKAEYAALYTDAGVSF